MNEASKKLMTMCSLMADGELTVEEEAKLLAACEQDPDGYRMLALSLVEHRRMALALRDWAEEESLLNAPLPVVKETYPSSEKSQQRSESRWGWLSAIAASLIVGVIVGYSSIRFSDDYATENISSLAGNRIVSKSSDGNPTTDVPPSSESVAESQQMPGVASHDLKDHAPAYVSNPFDDQETLVSLARELKPQPTLDDQAIRLLSDSGIQVERHNHVFLFDMSDGQRLAIPAEFTVLRSNSR